MEILGLGTDIVECVRVGRLIAEHGELFLQRIYTPYEIRYCQARKRATEHFAGRWAAKEAVFKCLGTGWRRGLMWTEIEIRHEEQSPPTVHLAGAVLEAAQARKLAQIHLTIAHCRAYATATALALRDT